MRISAQLIFSLFAALAVQPAIASEPAGSAVAVIQQASSKLDGTTALIDTGADVFMGQQVITGQAGQVQVVFKDNTHLVIGPGSSLVISQYLMRDSGTASKFVINALSGTFRFVTGNSQKSAYQINTPTGTLAVRGTAFDFGVDPHTHQTNVLLYHGRVGMCERDGSTCVWMSDACSVGVLPEGLPGALHYGDQRRPPILNGFPYLNTQQPLRQDFRVPGGTNCGHPPGAAGPEPITTATSSSFEPAPKPPEPPPCDHPPPPPCDHPSGPPDEGGSWGDGPQPEGGPGFGSHDGPPHDGPPHDGPPHDGPPHDGPPHDGPPHDGPPGGAE